MSEPRPLHRLFGLAWRDFFQETDVTVETEIDLSLKQQFLDLVIIHQSSSPLPRRLPDGFDLGQRNLVTFKSYQEALDPWALWELIGHFVNYCKQCSPSLDELLPLNDFRLFAVCARFPQRLAQQAQLTPVQDGVYDARGFGLTIRVIVASQLLETENNAMLHLFSIRAELLRYGREHYKPYSQQTSSLLYQLIAEYGEDPNMPDELKEFVRQTQAKMLEESLKRATVEERLKGVSVEERLKGLSAEEIAKALPREVLEEAWRQAKNGSAAKPQ